MNDKPGRSLPRPPASPAPAPGAAEPQPARVIRQFRVLLRADARQRHGLHRGAGMGATQVAALAAIQRQPGLGVNELAARLEVRQPTASNLVHGLCKRGLVLRQTGGADRRAVRLFPSSEGRALLAQVPLWPSGGLEAALRRLDAARLKALEQDMARLLQGLANQAPGTQSTP